jgi:hypothetical protein
MISRSNPRLVVIFCAVLVTLTLGFSAGAQAQTKRVTGKPTALNVSVAKVELWNGTAWVSLFTGTAQLDLVAGGVFPGISNLTLAAGTYTKLRITVVNSFGVSGSLVYLSTTYYTTPADGPAPGVSAATTIAGSAGPYNFFNPAWGTLGAQFQLPEFTIDPALVVGPATDYQPTLKFNVDNALELWEATLGLAPQAANGVPFYFVLGIPVVTIQ